MLLEDTIESESKQSPRWRAVEQFRALFEKTPNFRNKNNMIKESRRELNQLVT